MNTRSMILITIMSLVMSGTAVAKSKPDRDYSRGQAED